MNIRGKQVNLLIFGDMEKALKWLPYAQNILRHMVIVAPLTRSKLLAPESDVTIRVSVEPQRSANPHKIAIYADEGRGFILGLQGFNYELDDVDLSDWKTAILLKNNKTTLYWEPKKFRFKIAHKPPAALNYYVNTAGDKVYVTKDNILYRNGSILYDAVENLDNGVPVVNNETEIAIEKNNVLQAIVFNEGLGAHIVTNDNFTWNPEVPATGWKYVAGTLIKDGGAFEFLTMRETIAGAVQRWQTRVSLINQYPYFQQDMPETFTQILSTGDFVQTGGPTGTSNTVTWGPAGPMNMEIIETWDKVDPVNRASTGFIFGSDIVPSPTAGSFLYNKTDTESLVITLYSGIDFTQHRSMSVNAFVSSAIINWYGTWPLGDPLYPGQPAPPPTEHFYQQQPSFAGPIVYQGQQVGNPVGSDDGFHMENNASSTTSIKCPLLPKDIQNALVTITQAGINVQSGTFNNVLSVDLRAYGGMDLATLCTLVSGGTVSSVDVASKTTTYTLDIAARDYIYADFGENVFVYFEMLATGTTTNNVGGSILTFNLVLNYRGQDFIYQFYKLDSSLALSCATKPPDDISFGTAPIEAYFLVPNPPMPKTLFVPRWMHQGQCPYIAYTRASEVDPVKKKIEKMIFTMRFQLIRERRGINDAPPPAPPVFTETFYAPTIERVLGEHSVNTKFIFDKIEMLWPNVRFAIPYSTPDWVKRMQPGTWPSPPSNTWTYPDSGDFNINDADTAYGNVYRV